MQALIPTRTQQLKDEEANQETLDQLRQTWANKAAEVQAWIASQVCRYPVYYMIR